MSRGSRVQAPDLVPLRERLRYLRIFRLLTAVTVLGSWPLLPELRHVELHELAVATGAFLFLSLAAEGAWRLRRRRGRHIQTGMLLMDGLYLAGVCYVMGGVGSPLRTLVVVHLTAVALLASFRTGLKLALWHSILLYLTFYGQEARLLETFGGEPVKLGNADWQLLLVWIAAFWLSALSTASFAAVNERELRRQRYDLSALADLAYRLEEETKPVAIAAALVYAAVDDFDFDRALVLGCRSEEFLLLGRRGVPDRWEIGRPSEGSPVVEAMHERRSLLVESAAARRDPWLVELIPDPENLVIVPLHAEGRSVGALVAEHGMRRGSRLERRVLSMLERLCSQTALALDNAWLLDDLQHSAASDGLTGLANRGAFEEALGRELAGADRTGEPVSLLMLDIDHFKMLNDTCGHQAGDEALRKVAGVLREHTRASDLIARYGGEEFAVVLPGDPEPDALLMAERLRHGLALIPGELPLTGSFGVATYPDTALDPESLVRAADAALYSSKQGGRNRTTGASALVPAGRGARDGARSGAGERRFEPRPSDRSLRDPLTGLPGRSLFLDHVSLALARARRQESTLAVVLLDLDRVKRINDSVGHAAGDRLLVATARRLDQAVRASDVLARVGGDEFAVLCEVEDRDQALVVAQRLLDAVQVPTLLGSEEVGVTASVGVAVATSGERPQDLLRDADRAMHRAKERGGARAEVFDMALREQIVGQIELEKALREAVEREQLQVVYQPIVALESRRIVGFEALVRWQHPERGLILPADFIPIAEETGLIVPVGRHVLQEACRQSARWRAAYPRLELTMAVNLSARQLAHPDLVTDLGEAIAYTGIDPGSLMLEITESVVMEDPETVTSTLEAIRTRGVWVAVDDFGTGYSSLGSLRKLPVNVVKVDRSFVAGLGARAEDRAIIDAVKGMADALGLSLIAEGIETPEQLDALVALGCPTGQGMLLSPPLVAAEATELLRLGGQVPAVPIAAS
jgi:diguanylate cyclase (GGDEF)-like protein